MPARKWHRDTPGDIESDEAGEYVRVPTVIDATGDRVVTLVDAEGREQTRLVAELMLETFVGPRKPGQVLRFKDGDRLNCELPNLEWAAAPTGRDETARTRAVATFERAGAIRRALEGRPHSDSAELIAEDRLR